MPVNETENLREQWRSVPGWEGFYEVSDMGLARSVSRESMHKRYGVMMLRGRMLRPSRTTKGYLQVALSRDGRHVTRKIHRLVLETFVGPCPEGLEGAHEDGDKTNNALANLRWKTRSENAKDRTRHGTQSLLLHRYDPAPRTPDDIRRIREMRAAGMTQQSIADEFGISQPSISLILHGKAYGYVK